VASSQKDILQRTIEALEASLRRYPDNKKIIHQLSLAYFQIGRFDPHAVLFYEKSSSFFPNEMKIQQALAIAMLVNQSGEILTNIHDINEINRNSLARNITRLQQLSTQYPDSAYIHRALGDLQLILGKERDAIHHYRCAMSLGLNELEPLCQHYEAVSRLWELSGYVGVFFAELYQRFGLPQKADQIYASYLKARYPEKIVLEKYLGFLQRQIEELDETGTSKQLKYLRQLVRLCLLMGNITEAFVWARQLTPDQMAEDVALVKDLARRLIQMEDFKLAFDYLSAIQMDEEAKSLLNEITVLLEKRGELDTAVYVLQYINQNDELAVESRKFFSQPVETNNELLIEIETDLQMAELHWKNRRWEQAFERYIRVLELGYEDYRSLVEPLDLLIGRISDMDVDKISFLANFFGEKKDYRRSLKYAQIVLSENPEEKEISTRLLQACERILMENPNDCDVRLLQGDEYLRLGNIEHALQDFRRCAEDPEYILKANRRLALAKYKAGDLGGAFERYQNLPLLEGQDLERLYDLAIGFENNSDFKQAFEVAKLICEYDANFQDISAKYTDFENKMNEANVGFIIDPKMRELIGDHSIGRYKYIAKIGSGGMGVVHKVEDLKVGTVVAMKILREGLSSSGKAIDRFFREARIAATLHHKNIVNILDYNISNNYGQSYIAMEYVDGPSLRDIVEQKFSETVDITKSDVVQTLDWISQLCDALDATHKKGIIHRDIKPDNVLLDKSDLVKITDFGIVHIEEATFTPTGALIGTPRYMSPEQVHGGRIDARSDIYAVGIILYELLIGSPPFISGDISYQQVNVMATPPKEICPTIPDSVNRIIMKCLEKAPPDRYQSSLECKKDIDEAYINMGGDPDRRRPEWKGTFTPTTGGGLKDQGGNTSPLPSSFTPFIFKEPKKGQSPEQRDEDQIDTPAIFLQNHREVETRDIDPLERPKGSLVNDLGSDFDTH
jgi:serine/threonine protein kinase